MVKGITKNKFFLLIFFVSVTGQVLIVEYGGAAFQTVPLDSGHWILSVLVGLFSIPVGALIRLIPDEIFMPQTAQLRLTYHHHLCSNETLVHSGGCQADDERLAWTSTSLQDTKTVRAKFSSKKSSNMDQDDLGNTIFAESAVSTDEKVAWSRVV